MARTTALPPSVSPGEKASEDSLPKRGSIPELGLSATRSLRALEPEDYDAEWANDGGAQP